MKNRVPLVFFTATKAEWRKLKTNRFLTSSFPLKYHMHLTRACSSVTQLHSHAGRGKFTVRKQAHFTHVCMFKEEYGTAAGESLSSGSICLHWQKKITSEVLSSHQWKQTQQKTLITVHKTDPDGCSVHPSAAGDKKIHCVRLTGCSSIPAPGRCLPAASTLLSNPPSLSRPHTSWKSVAVCVCVPKHDTMWQWQWQTSMIHGNCIP